MTLWSELGEGGTGGGGGEKPAFLENGFQGVEEHVGWGCQLVGRGPRRRCLRSMCCHRSGFVCGAPGGGASAAPWPVRTASGRRVGAVVAAAAAREWAERSGSCPAAVLGVPQAWGAVRGTPSRSRLLGLGAAVPAPRGEGWGPAPRAAGHVSRRTGGRGSPALGRARGGEPCVKAETAALGGGESLWPGAAAASVWRSEVVLLQVSGGSDRGFGLLSGAGDGRLGLGLGGFPLKEVVGHLKAQSTCF